MNSLFSRAALQVSLLYAVVAGLWLTFSDWLLAFFIPNPDQRLTLATYQGWVLVVVTTLLLYFLLNREHRRRDQLAKTLQESQRALSTLLSNLPGMAYRCRDDPNWTMEFVSEGCLALTGFQPVELIQNRKVSYRQLIHAEDQAGVGDEVRAALQVGQPYRLTYRIMTAAGEQKWVWEQGCGVDSLDGKSLALEGFIADITEQVLTHQMMEQRVEEQTHELSALLAISRNITATLELERLLDLILVQLKTVVDYTSASIWTVSGDELKYRAYRGPAPAEKVAQSATPLKISVIYPGWPDIQQPLIIPDIYADTSPAQTFRQGMGERLEVHLSYIRSWIGLPLLIKGQLMGMLGLSHGEPGYFSSQQVELVSNFAHQAAVAIENARLYSRTRRHADELETLLAIQQAITGPLDLEAVLQLIADAARRLTETKLSLVYLLEGDTLRLATLSGEHSPDIFVGYRVPVAQSVAGLTIESGQAIIVNDVAQDPRAYPDSVQRLRIHAYLTVPLISDVQPIGVLAVADKQSSALGADDERILTVLASGAVVGLENARLYQAEQERRREAERRRHVAENLGDILAILNSSRSLDEILDHIVAEAGQLLGSNAVAVYRLHRDTNLLRIQAARGLPADFMAAADIPVGQAAVGRAVLTRQPVAVSDIAALLSGDSDLALDLPRRELVTRLGNLYQAWLAAPLMVKDEIYGGILLYYPEPRLFSDEEIELAVIFSNQVALAIENSRFQAQLEQAAVAAERNRLARDLHDAVTQTLFSASLRAQVLPSVWERHPEEARRGLEELRQLTRGALAEMRTLLLELRPTALIETRLGELLRHLTEAVTGRTQIPITLTVEGDRVLPPEVQTALYRIAQESLNNIAKHAKASQASVTLRFIPSSPADTPEEQEEGVELCISDNGRGFDPSHIPPEHLGVRIMHERAEAIGAKIKIESQIGQGTQVTVIWQDEGRETEDAGPWTKDEG